MTSLIIKNEQLQDGKIPAGLITDDVTDLSLYWCTALTELPELPNVTDLDLTGCSGLTKLPALPSSLTSLNLEGCPALTELPELPSGVTYLNLKDCEGLTKLPDLPGVEYMNLRACFALTELPELPRVKDLNLYGCSGLTALPALPSSVTFLHLGGCSGLTELPTLPSVTFLNLSDCSGLTKLPELPSVNNLNVNCCSRLRELPALPSRVTDLNLYGCSGLTALPALPSSVTFLHLGGCSGLTELPTLPSVTYLNLSDCSGLTELPALPSVTRLYLDGCSGLTATPELIASLENLESRGCEVLWPKHFSRDSQIDLAKSRLNAVIERYHAENPQEAKPSHIVEMFHRYLTESIGQRGGVKDIVTSINPILDALEKNPSHLIWAEETATASLAACVNQPVRGLSEIAAWVAVSKAETLADKLEAARQVVVLDKLIEFVTSTEPKPGNHVQVEAGNALLREVHKRFRVNGDIREPWLGVPGPVAYEGTINNWLEAKVPGTNDTIVDAAYAKLQPNLTKPLTEIASYLCETAHNANWAQIAFPEIVDTVKTEYRKKEYAISLQQEVAGAEKSAETAITEATTGHFLAQFESYNGKTKEELADLLSRMSNNRSGEIATLVSARTSIAAAEAAPSLRQPTSHTARLTSSTQPKSEGGCRIM